MRHPVRTREDLAAVVQQAVSVAEVCRLLGISDKGSMNTSMKRRLAHLGIDTSHFLGQGANRGTHHSGGPLKLLPAEILVQNRRGFRRERLPLLREAMLAIGFAHRCGCGQGPSWNGRPLVLQVDHINGDPLDNRQENIRFICPNCHTQTENFAGNKRKAP